MGQEKKAFLQKPESVASPAMEPVVEKQSNLPRLPVFLSAGVLIVVVVVLSMLFIKAGSGPIPSNELTQAPSPAPLFLTLQSPVDGTLAVNDEILVTGKTTPNTTVVLFTETDEMILESDSTGAFETTMKLSDGINTLVVTAYADSGEEKSETVTLVRDSAS